MTIGSIEDKSEGRTIPFNSRYLSAEGEHTMTVQLPLSNGSSYEVKPTKIVALGLNYLDHIKESQSVLKKDIDTIPAEPILFPKTPNVLTGPNQPVIIPSFLEEYDFENCRTDHEAELAIIIGDRCKNVAVPDAFNHVFGYSCFNDISQRNLQKGDKSGWYRGKSLDTFGPIGPRVVLPEHIGDPQNLNIECRVNGQITQQSNTSHMIFKIPEIIAFVSKMFTLEKGDIIITGTPSGVSALNPGDTVEVEIENIGILSNRVESE